MNDSKEMQLESIISELSQFENEFLQSSKRIIEAGNSKLFTLDFFSMAVTNRAISLTKAFVTLVKDKNYLSAVSLIRLQLDNALRFFASTLVKNSDDFVLHFMDGKEIRDYKDYRGKNLTDNYLAKELDNYFKGTLRLYKDACGYIHLSDKHFFPTIGNVEKKERQANIVVGSLDNFSIEQKIEFAKMMFDVSRLVLIIVEQWKHEKNRLGEIYDKNKK